MWGGGVGEGRQGQNATERSTCRRAVWEPADCPLPSQAHHTLLLGSGHVGLRNLGNTVRARLLSFLCGTGTVLGAGDSLTWESPSLGSVWRDSGRVSAAPQCFLNAVLQCLSSTRPLRDFCLRRDFRQEVPGGGRAQELTEGGLLPHPRPLPQPTDLSPSACFPRGGFPTSRVPLRC